MFAQQYIYAQQPATPADSLNFYQRLILDLEQNGLSVPMVIQTPEFAERMQTEGYSRDSLLYYYQLYKAASEGDLPAIAADNVAVVAKSYRDSIVLRWGPSSVDLWQKLNTIGYGIYRVELSRNAQGAITGIDTTSYRTLADTLQPLKPWPLDSISRTLHDSDTVALVATQALYGETFDGEATDDKLDFVDRNRVRNMRFGFSLMMADRSPLAADLLGLRWVDRDVKPDVIYIYFIVPAGHYRVLSAPVIVENNPAKNAVVTGLKTKTSDEEIKLTWPKADNQFSSYWIERSEDAGKTWKKLTTDVVVFMDDEQAGDPTRSGDMLLSTEYNPREEINQFCVFRDSTVNDINYIYRVSGQTPFADFSDYAYVEAQSSDLTPPPTPVIVNHSVDEKTDIAVLEWAMDFDEEFLEDLAGFTVWEGSHPDSAFVQISEQLPPTTRTFRSPAPLAKEKIHYYMLKAFDKRGNEAVTFPLYMHVIDNIPPAPPVNPAYVIDSTGVVTLVWEHNTEPDLLGYRVYFTNNLNYELTQLTAEPIPLNMFRDTIEIVTLTETIFYRIQAVDRSHNRSRYSAMIEVQKPDVIPPIAPILRQPVMNDSLIRLHWQPSSSEDVRSHIIYRRLYQNNEDWTLLTTLGPLDTAFVDVSAEVEQLYEYSACAEDDAGLRSELAFPVKARRWFAEKIVAVTDLQAVYDSSAQAIRLSWKFDPPETELLNDVGYIYYIYRSAGATPLLRYRTIESTANTFTDLKVKKGEKYNYAVMVIFNNGKSGPLSVPQSVFAEQR